MGSNTKPFQKLDIFFYLNNSYISLPINNMANPFGLNNSVSHSFDLIVGYFITRQ